MGFAAKNFYFVAAVKPAWVWRIPRGDQEDCNWSSPQQQVFIFHWCFKFVKNRKCTWTTPQQQVFIFHRTFIKIWKIQKLHYYFNCHLSAENTKNGQCEADQKIHISFSWTLITLGFHLNENLSPSHEIHLRLTRNFEVKEGTLAHDILSGNLHRILWLICFKIRILILHVTVKIHSHIRKTDFIDLKHIIYLVGTHKTLYGANGFISEIVFAEMIATGIWLKYWFKLWIDWLNSENLTL